MALFTQKTPTVASVLSGFTAVVTQLRAIQEANQQKISANNVQVALLRDQTRELREEDNRASRIASQIEGMIA